jgi:hypothetical protein
MRQPRGDRCAKGDAVTLPGLITRYPKSPKFEGLGERTQSDKRKHLDRVSQAPSKHSAPLPE